MYSTPICTHCNEAKKFLEDYGDVELEVFDVAADAEKRKEAIEKSDQMGVPVFEIGEEIVVGFNKTEINRLLNLEK